MKKTHENKEKANGKIQSKMELVVTRCRTEKQYIKEETIREGHGTRSKKDRKH